MDGSILQTYLSDVLHVVTQSLLAPDIVLLLAFIGYALFCIGSIIAERFSERRHFNVVMPKFLAALMAAQEHEMPAVIEQSGLLNRQKVALLTVYDYRMLPGDALVALIRRLVSEEETRYDRITGRNNMAARVTPMLGLMGTLIPLGPGIQALGKADTAALSSSLLVAFDTTVAGLVAAAVCLVVGKIRANWYGNYMSALDSAMATMLQKIEDMRAEGKIKVTEPTDYAFIYENAVNARSKKKPANDQASEAKPARGQRGTHTGRDSGAQVANAGRADGSVPDPSQGSAASQAPARGAADQAYARSAASQAPARGAADQAYARGTADQAYARSSSSRSTQAYPTESERRPQTAYQDQSAGDYSASRYRRTRQGVENAGSTPSHSRSHMRGRTDQDYR